jgi:hypothetical protein
VGRGLDNFLSLGWETILETQVDDERHADVEKKREYYHKRISEPLNEGNTSTAFSSTSPELLISSIPINQAINQSIIQYEMFKDEILRIQQNNVLRLIKPRTLRGNGVNSSIVRTSSV